ncbi:Homeodomain, partial [Rhizoctonia solani]
MSNRPSQSPLPSPPSSPSSASHQLGPSFSTTSPSMIHVGRPTHIASPAFSALTSHYIPRSSRFIDSDKYSTSSTTQQTTTRTSIRHATPPESMRASDNARGVKRGRSEELEDEGDERHGSVSGSETSEHAEQPIMPAPKKRTRTLMTPDQLTALHRLLSQTRFPTTEQREQCGREIGLSARRVQVWFQNQRQKSKAQQQASSGGGGSRQPLTPQTSGPYRVFNYNSAYYDPPHPRPYTSPHPYTYGESRHPAVDTSPLLRRTQRLSSHRRGSSSLSYNALHGESSYEYPSGAYPPPQYAPPEPEYTRSPASYYDRSFHSPSHVRSPVPASSVSREDTTLPPIWPDNERSREESSGPILSPTTSTHPAPARRPSLLPTGLPPPQPLEPTPIWNHPHTNPRYMRPLPSTTGLPSLLHGLGGERARSDPPLSATLVSDIRPRSDRGLGLELFGTTPARSLEAGENAPTSPERTHSAPTALDSHRPLLAESSPKSGEQARSEPEPARPQTSRGLSHSRRSSEDASRD